jgi:RHS repeat-associated protein
MPGPYNGTLSSSVNEFDYNGTHYRPGDSFGPMNACETIGFLNAVIASNPDKGFTQGQQQIIDGLSAECPATPNDMGAADAPVTPPNESNPNASGGDSGSQQGAPSPPVAGKVNGTGTVSGTGSGSGSGTGTGSGSGIGTNTALTEEPTRPPTGEAHPTHGGDRPQIQSTAGDPVDIFKGAFYIQEVDLTIPNTILPMSFTRFYRSGAASYGPFGWNWDHNFNVYLRELNTGNLALWRNLHEEIFKYDEVQFNPPRGIFEKLEKVLSPGQIYEITGDGGTVMHFERPTGYVDAERIPLLWIRDRHGNMLHFKYGAEDKLSEVKDDDDRYFRLEYDTCGLLVKLFDHAGRKFLYEHDEQTMQLVCVKSPAITGHPKGINKIYYYDSPWAFPELRHNIVRIEDSEGNVYLENSYESDPAEWSYARVTQQLYGDYLYQYRYNQLQWVPDNPVYINTPAVSVEMMNPDFGVETYTFNYRGDLLDQRLRLNKDKSYRVVVWQYEFDEQGNISKITRPDGSEIISLYDFLNADPRLRGKLLNKELTAASGFPSPSRIIWKGKYEPVYQLLLEEKNEKNEKIKYRYDFDLFPGALTNTGKLKEIIHPKVTLPDGSFQMAVTKFEHNAKGQLTATILPDGIRNEYVYGLAGNEKGRLMKQVFDAASLNIEQKLSYDVFGYNTERIDGNGNSTKQVYNALGLIEKSILPAVDGLEAIFVSHYNSDKKVTAFERPKGAYSDSSFSMPYLLDVYERDVLGYPVKFKLSSNTSESKTLYASNDFRGFPVEMKHPDGSRIKRIFDERGLQLNEAIIGVDGKKIVTQIVYDRAGKIIQEKDAYGLSTHYEYDGFSRVSKVTMANGTILKKTWISKDLLSTEETIGDDGTGTIRQLSFRAFVYDEKSRKIKETIKSFSNNPLVYENVESTYYYDPTDRLIKILNNRGGETTMQYDGLGRLLKEIDFEGNEGHYVYDKNDNLLQGDSYHKEPDGSVAVIKKKYSYDARNRQTAIIEPDGAVIHREYDDRNMLVKETDYLGVVKIFSYNSFQDKIKEVLDPGGLNVIQQWSLNIMSRPITYTDPLGEVSKYFYDSVGRTFKIEYPNGFSSLKTFNDQNQVIQEQLGSGVQFNYTYDAFNRMQKISNAVFPAPLVKVEDHEFKYDGLDRLIQAKIGTEAVSRKYDSQGRLIEESAFGESILCTYNDTLGTADKIWPDGRTEKSTFNLNGLITKVEETVAGTVGSGLNILTSHKPSGPSAFGQANGLSGIKINQGYDERKRIKELTVKSPAGTDEYIKYRYNAANVKQVESFGGQNPKMSYFDFDKRYRVVEAKDSFLSLVPDAQTQAEHTLAINQVKLASAASTHEEKFVYDAADARKKSTETGHPDKNYTYLPGHKIQNDGTSIFTYHPEGTLKTDGTFSYEADALGRIVKITSGAIIVNEIRYDALGRPGLIKEAGRPDKELHYLGTSLVQESTGAVAFRQITQNPITGLPMAYHTSAGTHYTLFDARLNLIGLMNISGNLIETYRYQTFGLPQVYNSSGVLIPDSAFNVQPVFGGMRYLSASGLYLATRRLMHPVHGVWLSADPKGYGNSPGLYVYVRQNPVDYADPEGEFAFLAVLAVMAVGAVVAGGLNAIRQGIAISEGSQQGWEWGQFGLSVGLGAVAAPLLVVAPELAVPLAAWGVAGGIGQISQGHYGTGAFDIISSLAPFGFKGPRSATFGAGTRFGEAAGLGPSASWGTRVGRFTTIENNMSNYAPSFGDRRIGVGFAPTRVGQPEGHVSVVFEEGPGSRVFLEKNAMRMDGGLRAWFNERDTLPEFYFPDRYGSNRPFSYDWVNIPRWNWSRALGYGTNRVQGGNLTEPFSFDGANCSNFVSDVLGQGGINGISENSSAGALARNFGAFSRSWPAIVGSGYGAPFYTSGLHIGDAQAADKK